MDTIHIDIRRSPALLQTIPGRQEDPFIPGQTVPVCLKLFLNSFQDLQTIFPLATLSGTQKDFMDIRGCFQAGIQLYDTVQHAFLYAKPLCCHLAGF